MLVEGEDEEGFTKIKVPAREKFKLDIIIPEKGTKLEWKFTTELHDIAFGVEFEVPGAVDIPVGRVPSNKEVQEGSVICGSKGSFTFDNRYSLKVFALLDLSFCFMFFLYRRHCYPANCDVSPPPSGALAVLPSAAGDFNFGLRRSASHQSLPT